MILFLMRLQSESQRIGLTVMSSGHLTISYGVRVRIKVKVGVRVRVRLRYGEKH